MKKSIIVLALALLMAGSVFAAQVGPITVVDTTGDTKVLKASNANDVPTKDTKIDITLKQYPKYMAAVTSVQYNDSNMLSKDNYMNVKHEDEITMSVNADTYKLNDTTGYYLTYFAYENNEKLCFSVKLSGNMKLVEGTTTTTASTTKTTSSKNQKEVRYTMNIAGSELGTSYDLNSTDTAEKVLKTVNATNLIGETNFGSFAITLKNYSTDTFQYNIAGKYEATATIKIYTV